MKYFRTFLIVCAALLVMMPQLSMAEGSIFPGGYWGPILSCTGAGGELGSGAGGSATPRCDDLCDVVTTTENVVKFSLTIVLFVLVPLMIMWAGFLMVTSGGNTEKVGEAKKIVTGVMISIALSLGAYLIIDTFFSIIKPKIPGDDGKWYTIECNAPEFEIFKLPKKTSPTPTE